MSDEVDRSAPVVRLRPPVVELEVDVEPGGPDPRTYRLADDHADRPWLRRSADHDDVADRADAATPERPARPLTAHERAARSWAPLHEAEDSDELGL